MSGVFFCRLGLAYAGSNREDVLSLLYPVLSDKNSTMEVFVCLKIYCYIFILDSSISPVRIISY